MAFKSSASPGNYGQQIAHVDNVSQLLRDQQKKRNNKVNHNKQLADNHRAYNQSFDFGIKVESSSRSNALAFDEYFRKTDMQFQLQGIENAHTSAIRNSEQRQAQVNKDTDQIVGFVKEAIGTGVDLYKQREESINKSQYNALENIRLTQGTSLQQFHAIRSIEKSILEDANTTDARVQAFRDKGYSIEQLRIIAGTRDDVLQLSLLNQFRSEIKASPFQMFATEVQIAGQPPGTTAQSLRGKGDIPGTMQAFNQHIQSIFRMAQQANGGNPLNPAAVEQQVAAARAEVMSGVHEISQKYEGARLKDEQLNSLSNGIKSGDIGYVTDRWNQNSSLIQSDWKLLEELAEVSRSGVDEAFLTRLSDQVNPHSKQKYGDQYGVQIDRIRDKIISQRKQIDQVERLDRNDILGTVLGRVRQDRDAGATYTPEGAKAIIDEAAALGLRQSQLNEVKAALNANMEDDSIATAGANLEWANTVKNNPHLIGWTEEKIWEIAPNQKWANTKISEMHTRQGRDTDLKSAEGTIETALKIRLGEQIKDRYGSETFYAAYDAALEKYKSDRATLGKNGHAEALKLFDADLGKDKHAGRYAVPDVSKDTETIGFNNFQLSAVDINTEPKTYKSLSVDLDKAAVNPSLVSSRLAAVGDIDTAYLTTEELKRFAGNYGNINAPDDPEMWGKMEDIRDAIGGNTTTMDVASAILEARGEEVQTYKVDTSRADQAIIEIRERLGQDAAMQFANGTATVKGAPSVNTGIIVTSARDASGEPGSDFVISNGERGARFNFPYRSRVVRIERNNNWETNLENNPNGQRGPGNFVELEVQLPNGTVSDVRIAHLDDVANIQVGQELPAGSFVGTQGRTGSTSGAHMSLDWYKNGTATPDWDAAEWFLNNYLRGNQSQQPQQQVKTEPIVVPMPEPEPEKVAFNKIHDLPGLPDVKVIESSIGEHGFNVRGPKGQWKQYRAEEGNLSRLKEKYPEAYDAYNEIVNRGGAT